MSRILFVLPLLVFGIVAGYFFVQLGEDPSIVPSALIDKPVPDFDTGPLLADKPGLATEDFRTGDVVLVNIWASWCIPCRAEHPLITRLAEDEGMTIYAINYKDKREDAIGWLQELGDPYSRIGFDESGRAGIEWGVYGVPETYVIDGEGRIRWKRVGPMTPQLVEDELKPLLAKLQ